MNTTDFIRQALDASRSSMMGLIHDLKDAPTAQPSALGGNHVLWILGHLIYIESSAVHGMILGKTDYPYADWEPRFGMGSQPVADASAYPPFDELVAAWDGVRATTLETLDTLTDDDLDRPAPGCPEEWKSWFGTIGKVLSSQIIHPPMHYGQLSDIRRSLGRPTLMV